MFITINPPETQDWATIPTLMVMASHIKGVDADKLSQCLVASPYADFFNNNMKIAGNVMGEQIATPAVYINGHAVQPLTMKRIDAMIEQLGE